MVLICSEASVTGCCQRQGAGLDRPVMCFCRATLLFPYWQCFVGKLQWYVSSAAPGLTKYWPLISISTKVSLNCYRSKKAKLHEGFIYLHGTDSIYLLNAKIFLGSAWVIFARKKLIIFFIPFQLQRSHTTYRRICILKNTYFCMRVHIHIHVCIYIYTHIYIKVGPIKRFELLAFPYKLKAGKDQ